MGGYRIEVHASGLSRLERECCVDRCRRRLRCSASHLRWSVGPRFRGGSTHLAHDSQQTPSLRLQEMVIFRVTCGKLKEQWAINDGWDASKQLGLFDPDNWKES